MLNLRFGSPSEMQSVSSCFIGGMGLRQSGQVLCKLILFSNDTHPHPTQLTKSPHRQKPSKWFAFHTRGSEGKENGKVPCILSSRKMEFQNGRTSTPKPFRTVGLLFHSAMVGQAGTTSTKPRPPSTILKGGGGGGDNKNLLLQETVFWDELDTTEGRVMIDCGTV